MKRALVFLCVASFALATSFAQGHKDTLLKKPHYGEGGGSGPGVPSDIELGGIAGAEKSAVVNLSGTIKVKGNGTKRRALLKTKRATYTLVLSEFDAESVFLLKGKRVLVSGMRVGNDAIVVGSCTAQ